MSVSQSQALSAIAFQLAAALDAYETEVAAMVRCPQDLELYQCVSRRMDEMRMYSASLPVLSVAWVEVMIRHFELTHGMWRARRGETNAPDLRQLHDELGQAVLRLSRKCVQLMPSC